MVLAEMLRFFASRVKGFAFRVTSFTLRAEVFAPRVEVFTLRVECFALRVKGFCFGGGWFCGGGVLFPGPGGGLCGGGDFLFLLGGWLPPFCVFPLFVACGFVLRVSYYLSRLRRLECADLSALFMVATRSNFKKAATGRPLHAYSFFTRASFEPLTRSMSAKHSCSVVV